MTNRAAYKIQRTEALASQLKRIWGASSLSLHIQGVDHELLHAAASAVGEDAKPGAIPHGESPPHITVRLGADLFAPVVFGSADPDCAACRSIVGEPAPAEAAGGGS
jgi:hypothetical protein